MADTVSAAISCKQSSKMFSDEITSRKKLGKPYYTNSNYRRLREKRRT